MCSSYIQYSYALTIFLGFLMKKFWDMTIDHKIREQISRIFCFLKIFIWQIYLSMGILL